MIQFLSIRNLALMEAVSLEFDQGFIAVTGETGAGKSILLGALALLAGNRMDKTVIRQGAEGCEVEAVVVLPDCEVVDQQLQEWGFPVCEDRQLLLFRGLYRNKGPKVRINGQLATVANLQELGSLWVDFHGPGEPQKLFDESWQLALLDLFADHAAELAAYRKEFEEWRQLQQQVKQLENQERLSPDELNFWKEQLGQMDVIDLSEEALQQLERDFSRLSQSDALAEKAGSLRDALIGDGGSAEQLGRYLNAARELGRMDDSLQSLADRLESVLIECNDLGEAYSDLLSDVEFSEEAAEEIRSQMDRWLSIKRKYGPSREQVLAKREEIAERIGNQTGVTAKVKKLRDQIEAEEVQLEKAAEKIRKNRVKAAHQLQKDSMELLAVLGFKKAKLQIEVYRDKHLTAQGNSLCRILFSPNAGQDLLPLNKIASSGELARVMLALKATLARVDATPVLVFDEVDANVGGEIARTVGLELARLGEKHQVFCITHLPQVAVTAASHLSVSKEMDDDHTVVQIRHLPLGSEERLDEIARMLGDRESKAARSHAQSLLAG
jgi:DNA repair protein RecN (Recombination protein N)